MPRSGSSVRSSLSALFWSFRSREPRPARGRRRVPLSLEVLEDRTLLNAVPVLSLPQTTFSVVKTATLSVGISATDKDSGQTLTFSLVSAPTGASISSTQLSSSTGSSALGTLTWTPTEDQGPAGYTFTVQVTDNGKPVRSATQTITVNTLAVGLVGADLLIVGTSANQGTTTNPGNDVASVSSTSNASTVSVTINGATSSFTVPTGGQIITKLFGGDDTFTLNEGTGSQSIGPSLSVDGGTGTNSATVNGTANDDAFTITNTTIGLAGAGTLTYSSEQVLTIDGLGGTDTVTAPFASGCSGSLTLTSIESATLSVTGTLTAGSSITGTNFSNVSIDTLAGTLLASGGSITGATITGVDSTGLLKATETPELTAGVLSDA